jgi:hypothetical protein
LLISPLPKSQKVGEKSPTDRKEQNQMNEKQIEICMRNLDISREEAEEMLRADEEIDKGAKLFELSPEQKKASKTARQAPRKVDAYGKTTTRERKADTDKSHLMKILETAIKYNPQTADFEMTNPEKEIIFTYNGRKFKIVLSAPRS